MKLQIEKQLLLCLCLFLSSLGWAQNVIFHETFDTFDKAGGNDGKWNRVNEASVAETALSGWHLEKVYYANRCVKMGTGTAAGSITTPVLSQLSGKATLTIKAGAWDATTENTTISVSLEGGGTINPSTFTLEKGKFNSYQATITGGTAATKIKIAAGVKEKNRFFLDDIKVEGEGGQPDPQPQPETKSVNSIAELLELTDKTPICLTLSRDNRGNILEAKGKEEAYVNDGQGAVCIKNFLTTDRGWHPVTGGQLVGVIEGKFTKQNGVPTIVGNTASDANKFLCLEFMRKPEAETKGLSEVLDDKKLRAHLVKIHGVQIKKEGDALYAESNGRKIEIQEHLHALNPIYSESVYAGRTFDLEAVVSAKSEETPVLYYVAAEEVKVELTLDETADNTTQLAMNEGRLANIVVKRTLMPDMWNTICLPFNIDLSDTELGEAQLAKLKGYDAATKTLNFESCTTIEAGVPYLIFMSKKLVQLEVGGVYVHKALQPQTVNDFEFHGIYAPKDFSADDKNIYFLGKGNKVYSPSPTTEALRAFRAYFRYNGSAAAISRFTVDGHSYDVTAIGDLLIVPNEQGEDIYDLSGRKADGNRIGQGVYIKKKQKQLYY